MECLDAERTHCRLWFECSTCLDPHFPTARKREGETVIHGVAHRVIDGMLMTPTDRCLIDSDDFGGDLVQAASFLGAIQDAACEAGNGRWYVDVEWNDGLDVIVGKTPTPAPENAGA